ncbi:hypothetical protein LTR66_006623 [Elasticomyces elasticus]|nr:hypothetical protein LTR66_006623 [Elasticomyces elasticus]
MPSVFGFTFGSDARDTPVDRRYSRPFEDSHNADRSALFLPVLWRNSGPPSTYITSLIAKLNIFTGFFGQEDVRIDLSAVVSTRVHHGSLNRDDLSRDEESRIPALESELRSLRQELDALKSSSQVEAELTRSLLGQESRLRAQLEQEKSSLHSELGDLRAELASTRQERERLAQDLEQRGEAAPNDSEIVREHFRLKADFAALEENFQRMLAERETFLLARDEALAARDEALRARNSAEEKLGGKNAENIDLQLEKDLARKNNEELRKIGELYLAEREKARR